MTAFSAWKSDYPYRGAYINLSRATERRNFIENELKKSGLGSWFSRVEAIDGHHLQPWHPVLQSGEIGAFLSHHEAVRQHLGKNYHLHIVEDDMRLSVHLQDTLSELNRMQVFDHFDIVLTDAYLDTTLISESLAVIEHYEMAREQQQVQVMNVANFRHFCCNGSYVVGQHFVPTLEKLLRQEINQWWPHGLAIDLFLGLLLKKGQLKLGVLMPFFSCNHSPLGSCTFPHRAVSPTLRVMDHFRQVFFFDDVDQTLPVLPEAASGQWQRMLEQLLLHSSSDIARFFQAQPAPPDKRLVQVANLFAHANGPRARTNIKK